MFAVQNERMNCNESLSNNRVLRFRTYSDTTSFTVTAPSFRLHSRKPVVGILLLPNIPRASLPQRRTPLACVGRLLPWLTSLAIHVGVGLLKAQAKILSLD